MRSQIECTAFSIAKDQPGRENQDYFDYVPESGLPAPAWTDFAAVVADGVGSSAGPSEAAAAAAQNWLLHVQAKFTENAAKCPGFDDVHFNEITSHAFTQAHEAVQRKTAGSACAASICLQGDRLLIGNVGDCRVYRIRGTRLEQLSSDQVDNEGDPTQVIGGKRVPQAYAASDTRVQAGDVILLCSDGVWKLLNSADILLAASNSSASRITAELAQTINSRKTPGSDDATGIVVLVQSVGRPFWDKQTESGESQLKYDDSTDTKINEVLAELLNRLRAPLDRQSALAEKALNQLGSAVDELKGEIDALRAEIGGVRRGRKQSSDNRSSFTDTTVGIILILGGIFLGWAIWGRPAVPPLRSVTLQIPKDAHVISQKYENDRLLVRFTDGEKKPKLAIFRLEDGGRPFAIVDMPMEKRSNGSMP